MQEILNRLLAAGFTSAHIVGLEIRVRAHRMALVIGESGDTYTVSSASGDDVARVCSDADEVMAVVASWRG